MTDKRMEAVIKAMELAMEEQQVMTVINLDMKPIAQAAISADPVTEDVKRLVGCLRFYATEWQGNADGDLQYSHLTRTWMEPTDKLMDDCGEKAQNELKKWSGE